MVPASTNSDYERALDELSTVGDVEIQGLFAGGSVASASGAAEMVVDFLVSFGHGKAGLTSPLNRGPLPLLELNASALRGASASAEVTRICAGPSFAYSLAMQPVHTHRDRVASLPPCCLYGAVIPIAPPLGPGRALTLPCGWNNAGAAGNELQRKPGLRE